MIDLLRFTITW